MKKIIFAAVALAAVATAASVQAAPRHHVAVQQYSQAFDGAKFFADEANRGN